MEATNYIPKVYATLTPMLAVRMVDKAMNNYTKVSNEYISG